MKKVFRFFGFLLGGLSLLLLGTAAWVNLTELPKYESKSLAITLPYDSASLLQGRKIVETVCIGCHLGEDGKLSGRLFSRADDPFGEIWSRNITRHPVKGIGSYQDGELAYLLRTGIKRNGEWAGPYMTLPHLSDRDLASLIACLRSDTPLTQPSESDPPSPKYSFLARALVKLGAFKPEFYDIRPVAAPPVSDKVAYGRYLATGVYDCYSCHSASFETNNLLVPERSEGFLGGGNMIHDENFQPVLSANLTGSKDHGLGAWTEAQFADAVRTGARPDGKTLSPVMPRFALLNDEEIGALWAYLQTVPVLENQVARVR